MSPTNEGKARQALLDFIESWRRCDCVERERERRGVDDWMADVWLGNARTLRSEALDRAVRAIGVLPGAVLDVGGGLVACERMDGVCSVLVFSGVVGTRFQTNAAATEGGD